MAENPSTTFQNSDFSAILFHKLFEQKQASKFCDITLSVNNKIIKAHRNVLACNSPYFDAILKNHKIIREHIAISCPDNNSFNAILNFMYTGEITVDYTIVEELLKLANQFLLTKVIDYCVEFLGTKLNVINCLFTYFLTKDFKLKTLCDIVENWIANHIEDVCKEEEILELNPHQLMSFFKNKNFILNTNQALNLLSQWVLRDMEKREKDFDLLVRCFPTNDLEPVEVFHHLDTSTLYNKSELCLYKILDYLITNNWMLSNFKTRYDVLQVKYGQLLHDKCMVEIKQSKNTDIDRTDVKLSEKKEPLLVKPKLKQKQQILLKKLILLGLRPDIRMSALKMLNLKRRSLSMSDEKEDTDVIQELDEKIGIKCPICLTTINDSLLLEQHLALSHAKNVTYKCGLCSFVCQYHGDYLNHMKTHFSGPPFKCDFSELHRCSYPHCKYTTSKKAQLLSHAKSHNGARPHTCGVCGRGFMEKSHLVRHERIHLEEKPFKCSHCDYASSRRDKLKEHYTRHHGENASAKVPYKARPLRTNGSSAKSRATNQDISSTTSNTNSNNFTHTNSTSVAPSNQEVSSDIHELIMQHQSHSTSTATNLTVLNSTYHHFGATDASDFHQAQAAHAQLANANNIIHRSGTASNNTQQTNNAIVNHHMLTTATARSNPSTATSTAAAVAAAMMLDPRFHHNSSVPYHPPSTPVSMAMAVVQSSQIQSSNQQSLQNCMPLF